MLISGSGKRSERSGNSVEQRDEYNMFTYAFNNPINRMDPSGHDANDNDQQGIPPNLTPPPNVPVIFVYRYTETEWAKKRIPVGTSVDFGKWTYIAIDKTDDPENGLQVSLSNIGTALWDTIPATVGSVFTFSNKFEKTRSRRNYVDVTFKLSYQHYTGPLDAGDKDRADEVFLKHHVDNKVVQLSKQLNKDLKYYYIEQFGGAVAAELVGGVLQLRTAVGEASAQVGGPAAADFVAGNAKIEKYVSDLVGRERIEDAQCIIQTRETNCVPSALEQALGPESKVPLSSMNAEASKGGYTFEDAVLYVRGRGIAANVKLEKSLSLADLEGLAKTQKPFVLNVAGTDSTGQVGHAIVIEGWRDDKFVVSDPLVGPYLQTRDGLALRIKGYGQALTNLR